MAKKSDETVQENTAPVAEREINIMSAKLTIKQLGDPKKAAATFKEGDTAAKVLLGYIYGRVTGIKQGKNPDQMSVHKYLIGMFAADPVFDPNRPISRSGKCILNESLQAEIEELFDVTDDKTGAVIKETKSGVLSYDFKYAVYVIYSTAALGYSWAFKPVTKVAAADPLAELAAMTFDNVKQITAPKPETEAA